MLLWIRIVMLLARAVVATTAATAASDGHVATCRAAHAPAERSNDGTPGERKAIEDPTDDFDDDDPRDGTATTSRTVASSGRGNVPFGTDRQVVTADGWEVDVFRPPIA